MKYHRIRFTLNSKIRGGNNDYIKDYIFRKDSFQGFYWEEPKFIGNIREKINFDPYVVDIELFARAKLHDLIPIGGPISLKLLISGKLKSILERYGTSGIQYFQFNVIKNKIAYDDYWILHMYQFHQEYIDFKKCEIIYKKKKDDYKATHQTEKIKLEINSLEDFNNYMEKTREKKEIITIKKVELKEDKINTDFFGLEFVEGGIGYFVSEKLKTEIEEAGCTGIEFQPSYLSYNEWTQRDGPRDQVYGRSW